MKLDSNPALYPFVLAPRLVNLLDGLLEDKSAEALCINFRDPNYSAEEGGFHPVEIHVAENGVLETVTDFAYFGMPPFQELGIELDWSFVDGYFRQFDSMYDLEASQALFHLWAENFAAYYASGVYQVEISPW